MATFSRGETSIHYEEHGAGYPVLLFAPGGLRSNLAFWDRAPFHPVRELAQGFRVIAMDQRNAGQSRAPVCATDDWGTYTADHVALLDHLGIERCHVLGGCIGGSFCLGLIAAAPSRVRAAVLQQPIGRSSDNLPLFHGLVDSWGAELRATRGDVTLEALAAFKENLYRRDFVFSVTRDDVRACPAPLLVLRGNDAYHPAATSEEIVRLAPRAELVESWKEGRDVPAAVARVRAFLAVNTPSSV